MFEAVGAAVIEEFDDALDDVDEFPSVMGVPGQSCSLTLMTK